MTLRMTEAKMNQTLQTEAEALVQDGSSRSLRMRDEELPGSWTTNDGRALESHFGDTGSTAKLGASFLRGTTAARSYHSPRRSSVER